MSDTPPNSRQKKSSFGDKVCINVILWLLQVTLIVQYMGLLSSFRIEYFGKKKY